MFGANSQLYEVLQLKNTGELLSFAKHGKRNSVTESSGEQVRWKYVECFMRDKEKSSEASIKWNFQMFDSISAYKTGKSSEKFEEFMKLMLSFLLH